MILKYFTSLPFNPEFILNTQILPIEILNAGSAALPLQMLFAPASIANDQGQQELLSTSQWLPKAYAKPLASNVNKAVAWSDPV